MPTSNKAPPPRSSRRWSPASTTKENVAWCDWMRPSSPTATSSSSRWARGWWGHTYASERCRPAARAAAYSDSASSADIVSGFSHSTCLPAASAFVTHSTCIELGSGM